MFWLVELGFKDPADALESNGLPILLDFFKSSSGVLDLGFDSLLNFELFGGI